MIQGTLISMLRGLPLSRVWTGRWSRSRTFTSVKGAKEKVDRPNKREEATTDFTPFNYVHYSMEPQDFCKHEAAIDVEAPVERCFEIWNEWDNLVDFLDLIGEIMTLVKKTEIKDNTLITFKSSQGMPLAGAVEFEARDEGHSSVRLKLEHAMPLCLLGVNIRALSIELHMKTILEQNMQTFKLLAEGKIPFSDEKYDRERAIREMEEMHRAYYRSGYVSNDKEFEAVDWDEYARRVSPYEVMDDDERQE